MTWWKKHARSAPWGHDVLALLDELRIDEVHFCGLSMGGVIGQWLGANAPDRLTSLILCNTAAKIGTPESWNKRIADVEQHGLASITEAVLERWFTPAFRLASPDAVAPFRAGDDIKVAQELMRHSSCRTTIDVYTRAVDQQKREASLKVVGLMLPVDLQKLEHPSAPSDTRKANRRCRQVVANKGV